MTRQCSLAQMDSRIFGKILPFRRRFRSTASPQRNRDGQIMHNPQYQAHWSVYPWEPFAVNL